MLKRIFRRQAYYYASVAFLLVSLVYTVAVVNQPYIGIELENANGQWLVTYCDPQGGGYKSGVRVGDSILKIDNDDPGNNRSVQKLNAAEGVSTLQIRRLDQTNDQLINISELSFLQSTISEIPFAILGFVFWLLGFMTWFRRPFLVQARALFWLNWFIGLAFVLAPASSRDLLLAKELEIIFFSAVPIFLINFISMFPIENSNRVNRLARLVLILMFVTVLIITVLQSTGFVHFLSPLRKLVLATVSLGVIFALWNLVTLLMLPKDKPEKNQANILLLGCLIGFIPFVLLTAIPSIFGFLPIMDAHISSLFVSVIPATWYYVIVNKYLPDSRRLLETTISFFGAGVIISFVVIYGLFFLKVVTILNLEVYLVTLTLTMLFIVCTSFIQVVISKLLEKYTFFKGNRDYRKRILKLNESLTSINEEDRILEEVVKSLMIEGALTVLDDGKGRYLKKAVGIFLEKPSEQIELEEFFQAHQKLKVDIKILPADFPAELYIPFVSNNFTCGIFLGHRYSHIKVEQDELPLITLISSQLAQRLITTFIIKELSKEIKNLAQRSLDLERRNQRLHGITGSFFKNIEQERKSIARDLHDGVDDKIILTENDK